MIQSVLYFALGFLVAGFLALLVAPSIWRRAVFLTRKRIESAIPLTANELQADKDKLRAEHAIVVRKVEMELSKQRAKATAQATEITALNDQIKLIAAERSSQIEVNSQLEKTIISNEAKISEAARNHEELQFQHATTSAELAARTGELESMQRLYQELEQQLADAAERQKRDELQIAKLTATVADLKAKRQEDQVKVRETRSESKATAELLKSERRRGKDLEKKFERLVSQKSDVEDKLSRREKELARLRDKKLGEDADLQEFEHRLADSDAERQALEREVGELTLQLNRIEKAAGDTDPEKLLATLQAENSKLTLDVQKLTEQCADLKKRLSQNSASTAAVAQVANAANLETGGDNQTLGDVKLRDELKSLAAQVVHMTALIEGEGGRLEALLKEMGGADPKSLAGRVNALKQAAEQREVS